MTITDQEAKKLCDAAASAVEALQEGGASTALMLWSRKTEAGWQIEWRRCGSPFEALNMASQYCGQISQDALATAIANKLNSRPSDDGEGWKGEPPPP